MKKRELILHTMKELMNERNIQSISVSDIAQKAGIGKGSIYYYFKSKEEIFEAVIESLYADAIEKSKNLVKSSSLDALTKMNIIFTTCHNSSSELLRQESNNYFELQQSALLHQQFVHIMVKHLGPILADIIRQGNEEGSMCCPFPEEVSEIVLLVLSVKMDNHMIGGSAIETQKTLQVFADILEKRFEIKEGSLDYLWNITEL